MPKLLLSENKPYQAEMKSPNLLSANEKELKRNTSYSSFVASSLDQKSLILLGNTYDKIRNQMMSIRNTEMISEIKHLMKLKDKLLINLANIQRKLESEGGTFFKMTQEKTESYFMISSLLDVLDNQVAKKKFFLALGIGLNFIFK
jgi:hypothetical protein